MGHSKSFSLLPENVIDGNHNHYKLQNKLGSGGNGIVYSVIVADPVSPLPPAPNGYAIKIFDVERNHNKREKRFIKEIQTVLKFQDSITEVVPIYDYSLGDDDGKKSLLWYLMPKAEKYNYIARSDIENLALLRGLGNTIAQLHALNLAHRDIKLDNILLFDNKLCLSDFGLVWDRFDDQNLTDVGEAIGPYDIRPPELDRYSDRVDNFDFRVSDVYLFAKTLWIILTKSKNGFKGEYSRGNVISSLNKYSIDLGDTLEPLHLLMESATKDDFQKRITINECLRLIDLQASIFSKNIPQSEINKYIFEERIGNARITTEADDMIIREDTKILDICRKLHDAADFVISNGAKQIRLGEIKQVQYQSNNVFVFSVKGLRPPKDIYVSIEYITIGKNNTCSCRLRRFSKLPVGIKNVNDINELDYIADNKYSLNIDIEAHFVQL